MMFSFQSLSRNQFHIRQAYALTGRENQTGLPFSNATALTEYPATAPLPRFRLRW